MGGGGRGVKYTNTLQEEKRGGGSKDYVYFCLLCKLRGKDNKNEQNNTTGQDSVHKLNSQKFSTYTIMLPKTAYFV